MGDDRCVLAPLSVRNWEQLRLACGWPQELYIALLQQMAADILIARTDGA